MIVLAAACSSAGGGGVGDLRVRPLSDILDGEVQIEGITSTSATVRARTSQDVVCSVVSGTDLTFDAQATDLDMGGGGHDDHSALLRSLRADTTYHYRLQGTGADGTVYVGETGTFRTPAASAVAERPNLASSSAGARVTDVSSAFGNSANWAAARVIDGDATTAWSSQGDGDRAFIVVELPQRSPVKALGRTWFTSADAVQQFVTHTVGFGTVLGFYAVRSMGHSHDSHSHDH